MKWSTTAAMLGFVLLTHPCYSLRPSDMDWSMHNHSAQVGEHSALAEAKSKSVEAAQAALSKFFLTQVEDGPVPFFQAAFGQDLELLLTEWHDMLQALEVFMKRETKHMYLKAARLALEQLSRTHASFHKRFTLAATSSTMSSILPIQVLIDQFAKEFMMNTGSAPGTYLVSLFVLLQTKATAEAEFKLHEKLTPEDLAKYSAPPFSFDVDSIEFKQTLYYRKWELQQTLRYRKTVSGDVIKNAQKAVKMVWEACDMDFTPQTNEDEDGIDLGVTSALRGYFQDALDMQRGSDAAWTTRWTRDMKIVMKEAIETLFPDIPEGTVLIEIPDV